MRSFTIGISSQVYECCATVKIEQHPVAYPELHSFFKELRQLESRLGEEAQEPYWATFLFRLKRCCFELCAVPFSGSYTQDKYGDTAIALSKHLSQCDLIYPDAAEQARDLVNRFINLIQIGRNPLLDAVVSCMKHGIQTALLLKESRFAFFIQNAHPGLRGVPIVSPTELRGDKCFDRLVVIGSPNWFPEYIFTAPRAGEIQIVRYNWIKGRLKHESVFAGAVITDRSETRVTGHAENRVTSDADQDQINPDELLPKLDLVGFYARTNFALSDHVAEEEGVEARGFHLEGDWAVFLEDSDTASAMIIDLDNDESRRVTRIPTRAIEPGMFILLRTEGGGDYIVPLADRILGKEAASARQYQSLWKAKLRALVNASSLLDVSLRLLDYGSIRANEGNIRNWMSARNIRTENYLDFRAIMRLIGLEEKTDEFWSMMAKIDRAHRKAGFHIRRLLLKQVKDADLSELQRSGRMDFELQGADAGSLTAFRVEAISQNTVPMPLSKIGSPFEVVDL